MASGNCRRREENGKDGDTRRQGETGAAKSLTAVDFAGIEERADQGQGKAYNVEITALYARNPARGTALDGVGSGLVHGLAGSYVFGDFLIGKGKETDGCCFSSYLGCAGGNQSDSGNDTMSAPGEHAQDAGGVGCIFRLAEDVIVEGDGGVGAQHGQGFARRAVLRGQAVVDGFCFFPRQTHHVGDGLLAGQGIFIDLRGLDLKRVTGLGEQFAAAG